VSIAPRNLAAALLAGVLLAACGGLGAPEVSDPEEILTRSIEAMGELDSVHLLATVDGTISMGEGGGSMSLNGTELEGDLDIEAKRGHFDFAVPAFLGLEGEIIFTEEFSYIQTSMTGSDWIRQPAADEDELFGQAQDPTAALDELGALLDESGLRLTKNADTACGDRTCYSVTVSVPAELLEERAAEEAAELPPGVFEDGMEIDVLIDKERFYLAGVSLEIDAADMGSVTVAVALSDFNEPVTVEEPPADQVTEGEGFTFP
jgi:hypothetical protein